MLDAEELYNVLTGGQPAPVSEASDLSATLDRGNSLVEYPDSRIG